MEKINIAELLKDCPSGMELDCTMYDNVVLEFVANVKEDTYPIKLKTKHGTLISATEYGCYDMCTDAKCVIFPKGKTSWEGFIPPCKFKDGDILISAYGNPFILKEIRDNKICESYCGIRQNGEFMRERYSWTSNYNLRLATEEEKAKLFKAIKDNGYRWNPKTKTLEKLIEPKFKVGDRIKHKTRISQGYVITEIKDTHYILNDESALPFTFQDEYELIPDKFDINTLKPFDKVLMRSSNTREWVATFYSHYSNNKFYGCGMCCDQCIPYEENKELLGTTNNPEEYGSR